MTTNSYEVVRSEGMPLAEVRRMVSESADVLDGLDGISLVWRGQVWVLLGWHLDECGEPCRATVPQGGA